jgi:hypothetical protein
MVGHLVVLSPLLTGRSPGGAGHDEPAPAAPGSGQATIERGKRRIQGFGECDVPSVVSAHAVAQGPHSLGERLIGKQVDPKLQKITMRERRRIG